MLILILNCKPLLLLSQSSLLFLYVGAASCTHDLSTAENVNDLLHDTNAQRNGSYVFRIDGNMTRQPSEGNMQFRSHI